MTDKVTNEDILEYIHKSRLDQFDIEGFNNEFKDIKNFQLSFYVAVFFLFLDAVANLIFYLKINLDAAMCMHQITKIGVCIVFFIIEEVYCEYHCRKITKKAKRFYDGKLNQ